MRLSSLFLLFAFAWCAAPAARAQDNCPMQTTESQPDHLLTGPMSNCKGIDLRIGSLVVSTPQNTCPTFVVYTPAHETAIASKNRTMVDVLSSHAVLLLRFDCQQDWFLIFPIGSSCVLESTRNIGMVHRMVARPCAVRE
jgi:hypothetical protein